MVHPDVAHRAAITQGREIPIIAVVLSLGGLVPFPEVVELKIADDDIAVVFDVQFGVPDS